MQAASVIVAPSWIEGASLKDGLDLLGLRLPVQFIGGTLLDGVTTVTPSVRYLAFRAWLIECYGRTGQPDSWESFAAFAGRIEAALVLANLVSSRSVGGLVGGDEATLRLNAGTQHVSLSPLVAATAAEVYTGPSDQLGISRQRGKGVPALTAQRGVPLAACVDRQLSGNPLIARLFADPALDEASLDDLRELGSLVRIDRIPDEERRLLADALMPQQPLHTELSRIGTYASLLSLAARSGKLPSESMFFRSACSEGGFDEPALTGVADGWTTYCIRDAIAVTQEAVLAAVVDELAAAGDAQPGGVAYASVIAALVERTDEHDCALRDLGLLRPGESVAALSYREMHERLASALAAKDGGNIVRWPGQGLIEPQLYERAASAGAGALSLAVVAWMLVAARAGGTAFAASGRHDGLSYQGARRMGMRDVILPALERYHDEDKGFLEVAAAQCYRTVQQHLEVAWSRQQNDFTRDVALLTTEGKRWFPRDKGFGGGRTASRLRQAIGWLRQLQLIDDRGTTPDGEAALQGALALLAQEATV